jgi:hypothetical protein
MRETDSPNGKKNFHKNMSVKLPYSKDCFFAIQAVKTPEMKA